MTEEPLDNFSMFQHYIGIKELVLSMLCIRLQQSKPHLQLQL
jgi:hypothetical protein